MNSACAVTVVVSREMIKAVATFLRDEPSLRYDMLAELNGVDYLGYPVASIASRSTTV